ncbi:hypothetical protein [Luteolibacter sp. LG18]|uniref:hypothetical protein n=1 Tax=Luteolibacter sp. LG18 TaxID=2819286 RepID=UPI002B2FB7C1|nr:hypothetical protein llg_33430 [Luteolibacter sp. LG18]
MNSRSSLMMLAALVAVPVMARGGDLRDPAPDDSKAAANISVPSAPSPWRVGASYAPFLGLKTTFSGLGRFNSPFTPQPLGGGQNRDYDDGFVHVDSSGPNSGGTWNWGYQNNSQYNPAGDGSISFSITNSQSNASAEERNGAQGFELMAYRDLGPIEWATVSARKSTWGLRGGFQYGRVEVGNHDFLSASAVTTTDTFGLGGSSPAGAPYSGSFSGWGVVLDDNPTRTTTSNGQAIVSGTRDLESDLFIANFGPYFQIPVTDHFDVTLEAGVSLAVASGSYDYLSSTSLGVLGTQVSRGSGSDTSFLPGLYVGLSGIYQLNEKWALQGSGRYQYMESFEISAGGSQAELSFDSAFVVSFGVLYSF